MSLTPPNAAPDEDVQYGNLPSNHFIFIDQLKKRIHDMEKDKRMITDEYKVQSSIIKTAIQSTISFSLQSIPQRSADAMYFEKHKKQLKPKQRYANTYACMEIKYHSPYFT